MGLLLLLAQSLCMFAASFIVGYIPLWFKSGTSGKRLKAISVMGMGLLVGAALTIIIPEGVSTLFAALPADRQGRDETAIHAIGISLLLGFALMLLIESLTPHPPHSPPSSPSSSPPASRSPSIDSTTRPSPQHLNSQSPILIKSIPSRSGRKDEHKHGQECKTDNAVHGLNATLGMVIHGAADGIALGASSLSGHGSLGLIVFLAVLVHKGPTALGLTTTLLSLSLSATAIRRRLIIFSFAAPTGAILTYLLVSAFGNTSMGSGKNGDVDTLGWYTGIALLFSGGSFLYVATVIQPLSATSSDQHSNAHHSHADEEEGHDGLDEHGEPTLGKYERMGLLALGMGAPVLLSWLVGDDDH
ncbi:hypothetical protein CI109_103543 [Kwoniella shandongensis]|uniref:Uncharacterized protein n=1 Tax=Kwoniella shandongensis TaxID=1734106 RepID=A0A5M6BXV9_9TREE|nr:uncharacterized protein CI109_004555 [Kwoniella shandongensis]KAA5527020.1 hypothetical protein CI109_004555 [Kwoniella shandongensis]